MADLWKKRMQEEGDQAQQQRRRRLELLLGLEAEAQMAARLLLDFRAEKMYERRCCWSGARQSMRSRNSRLSE